MLQWTQAIDVNHVRRTTVCTHVRPRRRRDIFLYGISGEVFFQLCCFESVSPHLSVDSLRTERPDALCEHYITAVEAPAQIEDFYRSAIRAVHLKLCDKATTSCTQLLGRRLASQLRLQSAEFVNAFPQFQRSTWLPFPNIASEVASNRTLCALGVSSASLQGMFFNTI